MKLAQKYRNYSISVVRMLCVSSHTEEDADLDVDCTTDSADIQRAFREGESTGLLVVVTYHSLATLVDSQIPKVDRWYFDEAHHMVEPRVIDILFDREAEDLEEDSDGEDSGEEETCHSRPLKASLFDSVEKVVLFTATPEIGRAHV